MVVLSLSLSVLSVGCRYFSPPSFLIERRLLLDCAPAAVDQRLDPARYHFVDPTPDLFLKHEV